MDMKNNNGRKQAIGIAAALFLIQPIHAFAAPASVNVQEEWTLATVPILEVSKISTYVHTVKILTDNPDGTEMLVEKSNDPDFSSVTLLQDWTSHHNGDEFDVTLVDAEIAYIRVKARNGRGVETSFSSPLTLIQKPAMPTLATQSSTDKQIKLVVNSVVGAQSYKVKRTDTGEVFTFDENMEFVDHTVLPAREYTYEFWAFNGAESEHNTVTLWTKPETPSLEQGSITHNSITLKVDIKDNPSDITIEAQREGGTPRVEGTQVIESGLSHSTSYTYEVRLKSDNNEYTEWVSKAVTTARDPLWPTQETVEDVTIVMDDDGKVTIGGVKNPNEHLQYSVTIRKKDGTSIDSPLFGNLDDVEKWMEGQLERNTEYEIVFGVQKGNEAGSRVEKIIYLVTPPAYVTADTVSVTTTHESASINLSRIGNPPGTIYRVNVNGKQVETTDIATVIGLTPDTSYTTTIEVKRPDGSFMLIGAVSFKTKLEPEEALKQEAERVAGTVEYQTDGVPNSGKAWVDVKVGETDLDVYATIYGVQKKISTISTRFDDLDDNREYTILVTMTDGKFTYTKDYKVTTPNRTPPYVENAYTKGGDIVLEVVSKNGIKE